MPETAHKFKDNGWVHDESIHKFLSLASTYFLFPTVSDVLDGLCVKGLLVSQPLQGGPGLIDPGTMPALRGLYGNVIVQMFLPPVKVAR